MSTKPSLVPVWNTSGDNNIEPSAGKKVTGWGTAELPPVQDFHWLHKLIGEWLQYLSDGALVGTDFFHTDVHEIALHPAAFEFDSNNTNANTLHADGYRYNPSAVCYGYAPVTVKVGDRITRFIAYYNPNGGGNMQPKLRRIKLSDGTISNVWAGGADNTGAAIETQDSGALAHDVESGYAYFAEMLHSGVANHNHGAIIKYTRPLP